MVDPFEKIFKEEDKPVEKPKESIQPKHPPPLKESNIRKEHPELARLHTELNKVLISKYHARSRDLQRLAEMEENSIKTKIKEYKEKHGITRDDYLKWNG